MKQLGPKVSVGLPVYNGERHLPEAIQSILGQTFKDLELVISDNASTDGTQAICREWTEHDPRVRYYRNAKNIGVTENYNAVFRHANGRYFKWAAANDWCNLHLLESCVQVLDGRPDVALVYPRTRLIRGQTTDPQDYEDRLNLIQERACERFRTFVGRVRLCNAMYGVIRSNTLRRTHLVGRYINSDRGLLAELTLYGKFVELPDFLFFRRMDPSTASTMRSKKDVARSFDPERRNRLLFQQWRLHRAYLAAIMAAPVPVAERVCLYRFLSWRFWGDRGFLAKDLREAGRAWFGHEDAS